MFVHVLKPRHRVICCFCENVLFVCPDKRENKQNLFRKASFHVIFQAQNLGKPKAESLTCP